ncbi:MAG: PIN domain-containing protein [Candidatus Competibacteraceae bacterium]|nr:MAG: PIN domain-containing protein [Candidatus Competibacteraceae bacterium]
MRRVLVDSGGFFALLVREDQFHDRARSLFGQANSENWRLMTTNVVVIESYALLLTRAHGGRHHAIRFLDMVSRDAYQVERISQSDEENAMRLVRAHQDKAYSLCDALSFVVMERIGIEEAIAFDRHFHEYGRFRIL